MYVIFIFASFLNRDDFLEAISFQDYASSGGFYLRNNFSLPVNYR